MEPKLQLGAWCMCLCCCCVQLFQRIDFGTYFVYHNELLVVSVSSTFLWWADLHIFGALRMLHIFADFVKQLLWLRICLLLRHVRWSTCWLWHRHCPCVILSCISSMSHKYLKQVIWAKLVRRARALAESLSSSCLQVVLVYRQAFLRNTLCAPRSQKSQKTLKPLILEVQGHSMSLTLTPLKGVSLVLVMISSMSAYICKRFHATQANSGKITTFQGYPYLTPACATLLEPRGSELAAIKSMLSVENFVPGTQVVLVCLQPFLRSSLLKCVSQPEIMKKNH